MYDRKELIIENGMSDEDIRHLINIGTKENFLTVKLHELTYSQVILISSFKGWRIDLGNLVEIDNKKLQLLSKYKGNKVEISGVNNINKTIVFNY